MLLKPKSDDNLIAGSGSLHFTFLPGYARFLLDNCLNEFASEQLKLAREVQLPALRFFESMPEEKLIKLCLKSAEELLQRLSQNKVHEYINYLLRQWKSYYVPAKRNQVHAQDIIAMSFIQRKTFRDLLPRHTSDITTCFGIMEEADQFTVELQMACFKTLFDLQQEELDENQYLIEKINNTSPGILYVYDLNEKKQIYSNDKLTELLGFTKPDIKEMGSFVIANLIHRDEIAAVAEHIDSFEAAPDGEIRMIEYRIKDKAGIYHWHRGYNSVFKRNDEGIPTQIIGITIDISKEKEIEEQLRHRESQLIEAQEIAELGSFEWDIAGNNSEYSKQMIKILELESKSNLASFLEYVHPGDRTKVRDAIDAALKGEGIYECEYRYRKNQEEKVIWSRGIVSFINGRPDRMRGTVMDVTHRHHMIKLLQRSEELNKKAQAIAHIGNWTWDLRQNTLNWADELYRMYELPLNSELNFDQVFEYNHPDDQAMVKEKMETTLQTHAPHNFYYRIVLNDRTEKVLHAMGEVLLDEKDVPYKMVGTLQDVTNEYHLNQELKEREEAFKQLIYNAPDAVIVTNANGKVELWNPQAEKMFGWTTEEITGAPLVETIVTGQYRKSRTKGIQQFFETGEGFVLNRTMEIIAKKKNREEFYVSLSIGKSVRSGKAVFISFLRDISAMKRAEMELEEKRNELALLNESLELKNRELKRTNEELTSFSYIASHDLQEPLRKIKTYSNRIIEKDITKLPDTTRDFIERIKNSSSRMQALIDDLLSFSRATSSEKKTETVDLNILLEEVKSSLKHVIEEKNAIISASPLPMMTVIPFQFHQLFENVITNAIKYSRRDVAPHISISCDITGGGEILKAGDAADKNYYLIRIADNGIGFEEQHKEKIFELFQRLHPRNEYSGTGIGLAICRKIVLNHNGFITAESIPGEGSVFNIYIPIEKK